MKYGDATSLLVVLQVPGPYSLDRMNSSATCCWKDASVRSFTVVTVYFPFRLTNNTSTIKGRKEERVFDQLHFSE